MSAAKVIGPMPRSWQTTALKLSLLQGDGVACAVGTQGRVIKLTKADQAEFVAAERRRFLVAREVQRDLRWAWSSLCDLRREPDVVATPRGPCTEVRLDLVPTGRALPFSAEDYARRLLRQYGRAPLISDNLIIVRTKRERAPVVARLLLKLAERAR